MCRASIGPFARSRKNLLSRIEPAVKGGAPVILIDRWRSFFDRYLARIRRRIVGLDGSSASLSGHPRNVRLAGVYDTKSDGMIDGREIDDRRQLLIGMRRRRRPQW